MGTRIKRTALSLVIVVLAYAAYALVAVPLIEPSVVLATSRGPSLPVPPRTQSFAGLFPPGSWELDRPKILETEQGTLLFDDYEPLADRRKMRLNRCTFIRFLQTGKRGPATGDKPPGKGRPVILKAMSGAVLEFNRPLDVARGEFGDLEGGQLSGEVIITSPPTGPDCDDAIRFTTRNVQIDRQRIWTPHEVDFQYGPHRGHGRDLRIEWSKAAAAPGEGGSSGSSLRGVRSLELARLERLELQMREGDSLSELTSLTGPAADRPAEPAAKSGRGARSTPVEVSCRGPCRFDVLQQIASLSDQVSVVRDNLEGPSDQLQGELLEIHFAEAAEPAANGKAAGSPALRPTRLVTTGYPATIRVPSRGIDVQAGHIEYDLQQRRIRLEDNERVLVSDPQYRVEARQLEYEAGPPGRLGRLWALGPGHLWGKATVRGRDVEATWTQEVRLRPHENNVVLSLVGGGEVSVAETARFVADEMHLFLLEEPKPGTENAYTVLPDRMRAIGNVALDSTRLSAAVREANVWFRKPPESSAPPPDGEPDKASGGRDSRRGPGRCDGERCRGLQV